jgi:hypothetical protein
MSFDCRESSSLIFYYFSSLKPNTFYHHLAVPLAAFDFTYFYFSHY